LYSHSLDKLISILIGINGFHELIFSYRLKLPTKHRYLKEKYLYTLSHKRSNPSPDQIESAHPPPIWHVDVTISQSLTLYSNTISIYHVEKWGETGPWNSLCRQFACV